MTILRMIIFVLAGIIIGYVGAELRPKFWPQRGMVEVAIGQEKDGTKFLQLNLEGRPLGWATITPGVKKYLQTELANDIYL